MLTEEVTMSTTKTIKKKKKPSTKRNKRKKVKLDGIPDLRTFFHKNETPIYFISATNFNLLGADEWVKGLKFISYIDSFDGQHPNMFCPEELPHDEFQSIEDINNYLLEHKQVVEYVQKRTRGKRKGKALFLMFDERTEELAEALGLEIAFPKAGLRTHLDNKVVTNRVAEKAGVPCVPYVLSPVSSYEELCEVSAHLGGDLVVQLPFGDSGHTTFFISSEADWEKYADKISAEDEVKVMKRIECRGAAIEACVTRHGTVVAPLMTELVGFKELTPYKGGWCGNEIYADAFTKKIRSKARKYTRQFGEQLKEEGYTGYFELDFLIDEETNDLYLGELNPRITGASSITNHAVFALSDAPLFLFHMLEYMGQDYELSVNAVNRRWAKEWNIDSWGQLVIKYTEDNVMQLSSAPPSGIYRINKEGEIKFSRMDSHRRAVETENEAFFMRISKAGDFVYEGADLGILVLRGRLMTDEFHLKERAKQWIKAIRNEFRTITPEDALTIEHKVAEIGGFKMM